MRCLSSLTSIGVLLFTLFLTQIDARVQFLDLDWEDVELGEPFTLRWEGQGDEGVNIWLTEGPANSRNRLQEIGANQEISGADWTVVLENAPDGEYAFEIEDIETGDISYSPVFDLGDGEGEEDNANRSSAPPSSTTTSSGGASNTDPTSSEGGNTRDGGTTSPPATSATGTQETGSPGSSSSDSGLSTGAKAGIGVGAGLGGILIVLLVAWLFYRRRKARSAGGNNAGAIEAAQTRQERVVGQPVSTAELTGNPISELPADDYGSYAKLSELPSPESSPGTRSDNGGQNGGFVARSELQ